MEYESHVLIESQTCPGVRFRVRRLSLARRMDLIRSVRETGEKLAFHLAGNELADAAGAAEIQARIDILYLRWGLAEITGLTIDGGEATVERFLEAGPDRLAREVVSAVKAELFLTEDERKN